MQAACTDGRIEYKEIQLTNAPFGHCLNSTQCFSPDGNKIVYDTRNDDSLLAANGEIHVLDITTGKDLLVYKTANQSAYGPGVGAATFSPDGKTVLFLGGIQNASKENPYTFTRRTGIAVAIDQPLIPIWMDARDIAEPFTAGALRGGTHAHSWSGDGKWISFTYNDHVLSERIKTDASIIDTRTVGIMFPGNVLVNGADGIENKNGRMFSVLISSVVKNPRPGSDEILKAFDECWIGSDGYIKSNGERQQKAVAFQGHIIEQDGTIKTEIFIADIPAALPAMIGSYSSAGTITNLPPVPACISQRRITFIPQGISATPRHWLRSVPDGSLIGFLAADEKGIIQLWGVSPNGGSIKQLTYLSSSITGPFNFSPDGKFVAYTSDAMVYITRLSDSNTIAVTKKEGPYGRLVGAVVWSPVEKALCYNRYVKDDGGSEYLQLFMIKLSGGYFE